MEEKQRLLSGNFDKLWKDLWILNDINIKTMGFKNDYLRGKSKYEKLAHGFEFMNTGGFIDISYFVDKSATRYETSEWEFPKGRRNLNESDKECAEREFHEETGYIKDDYTLVLNLKPLTEEYVGENKVRYKHVYYVGYLKNIQKPLVLGKDQLSEIKDIRWMTKEESLACIRDYHHTRFHVIHSIFDFIKGLDSDYFIT